ncbi:hypothetical protein LGV59_21115 [Bacteroides fragilis]|nr:hypothetical protein [Bacteroides fragilis]
MPTLLPIKQNYQFRWFRQHYPNQQLHREVHSEKGESIGSFYGFKTDGLYTQADIDAGHYYTLSGVVPNAGDIKFVPQRDIEYNKKSQMKIVLFLVKMFYIWRKFESAI